MEKTANIEDIKKNIKKNPKDAKTNRLMGRHYLRDGNFKEAVRFYQISAIFSPRILPEIIIDFEEFLQGNIGNIPARLGLVDFHLSQGNLEAAIIELEELVEIAPETAQIYNLLGRIYLKLGRIDGAIALLEKAMEAGKGETSLLEALAGAYIEKERYADAILLYEKLSASNPRSKSVLRVLSELYSRLSNFDSAAAKCAQMLSDDPEVISEATIKLEELARMSPNSTYVLEQLAESYIRCLKPSEAVLNLSKIMKLNPGKIDTVIRLLRKLLQTYPENQEGMFLLAECLIKKGIYSEAVDIYNKLQKGDSSLIGRCIEGYRAVIDVYPDQALARQNLADNYFAKGRFREALTEFGHLVRLNPAEAEQIEKKCKDILKQDPDMTQACLVLAEAFLAGGEARKAITIAEELSQKDRTSSASFRVLGEAYDKIGVLNRSKEAFMAALKISPFDSDIQNKYQKACEKELDQETAKMKVKIEQDPWRAGLNHELAKLLLKRGLFDAAVRALQNALKDAAKASASHCLMGAIFKEEGRFDLAQAQFEKALEFKNPDEAEIEYNSRANFGSCLEAQGRIDEAVSIYESILAGNIEFGNLSHRVKYLNSTNPYSTRNKAMAVIFEKSHSGSAQGAVTAVWGRDGRKKRAPDEDLMAMSFGQGQNNHGVESYIKNRLQSAEEDFILASQLDGSLFPAVNNLGVVCLKNGDIERACSLFTRVLLEDAGNPIYHNNLGVYFMIKQDTEKAEKEFLAVLKADKEFNAANINLGDIEMKKGRVKEAIAYYDKVGLFDPLFEAAQRRLLYWIYPHTDFILS